MKLQIISATGEVLQEVDVPSGPAPKLTPDEMLVAVAKVAGEWMKIAPLLAEWDRDQNMSNPDFARSCAVGSGGDVTRHITSLLESLRLVGKTVYRRKQ